MNRRTLIKLTGLVAAGQVLPGVSLARAFALADIPPVPTTGTPLMIHEPGMYRVSGVVRLDAPSVEISGIANAQTMSWANGPSAVRPVSSFMSFEHFARPGVMPAIRVSGGRLESLTVVRVDEAA